jgi:intracellular septation protein
MKFLLDFLPIILFFGAFKLADLNADAAARFATEHLGFAVSGGVVGAGEAPVLLATVVVIAATLLQISFLLLTRRKVDTMLWITFALVTVLGGATVWFHNPTFIKWKPSVLYWAMGVVFWASQTLFGKNVLQSLLHEQLQLPGAIWQRLNFAWIAFFILMGLANLYVAYTFSTSTWATFKVFGLTGLMLVFMLAQGAYVARHVDDEAEVESAPVPAPAPAPAPAPEIVAAGKREAV